MAVVKKSESLADEQIIEITKTEKPEGKSKKTKEQTTESKKTRKKGFLRSTVEELKKVEWPSFKYTVTWGAIVIVFTIVMSLTLGSFDHVFKSGMSYVDCTANYKTDEFADKDYKECTQDAIDNLAFKKDQ